MDLHKRNFGKLYGDKGYISKDLFEKLFVDGVHLITKIKKNMKNSLMLLQDKIALRTRALIETVNDELKNIYPLRAALSRVQIVLLKILQLTYYQDL